MGDAIGHILPLAVAAALSPFPIVAVVLLLATPRASADGLAFLLGWLVGLSLVGAVMLLIAGGVDATENGEPATWVSLLELALGALLLFVGIRGFRGRPSGGEQAELPKWMRSLDSVGPPKAFGLGLLLSGLNPKNLLLTVAAAAAIAETGIDAGQEVVVLAIYILLGSVGVGAPVVLYFVLGERSHKLLDGLRSWMAANNAVIMAVVVLVIAAKLIGDGIAGL
jgi:threonine/homoserine/homoserine lactone efflux protein